MAIIPEPIVDKYSPITIAEAEHVLRTGMFEDDPALKLVVQDAQTAENFENQKQWIMGWAQASVLYQSPYTPRYWEGTQVERSSIPFFTVATAVNALVPQVINGLFYENPPFMIQPRPGTRVQVARATGALVSWQLEDIGFREELRLGVMNAVLYGTGIWKYGWESYEKTRTVYRRANPPTIIPNPMEAAGGQPIEIFEEDEEIVAEDITERVDRPVFEHIVNLRHVLVDPGLNTPDIQRGKFVIHRMYLTFDDLELLRGQKGFDIPSREEVISWFMPPEEEPDTSVSETSVNNPLWDARSAARYERTTIDPTQQQLEVLERWDNDRVIMVLQRKKVLCNQANPYGKIPFLSMNWWDVPEAFWGLGLAKTIGAEQRIQQGITNTWIDNAALNLNGIYVRVRGKNVPTQNIRIAPGKIVDVDDKDGFKPIQRFDPVPEAGTHITMSQARVEQVSAANEPATQGIAGSTGHSNLARSASGANLIASGSGNRISDVVEKISDKVITPFLETVVELNRELLPLSMIRNILGKELNHEYMNPATDEQGRPIGSPGDPIDILNASVKFEILAAAKLQARRNMAQSLPFMTQYLMSPEVTEQLSIQGKKIDIAEIVRMFFVVSDWKNQNDVVLDMTPEDKQRHQQMLMVQQNAKGQQQAEMEQQKFQNKRTLNEDENIARAARDALKGSFQKQIEGGMPEAVPTA